ncbi:unnamed protein product [Phaedon cochleariae]|uniref:Zinc finger DNA binding protein n=1 Tax=Phaedon cochleariae TaxID=80249 RepID=A0A9N9SC69_PHACE|nr:unnamed protein product [Phaedon cochleariae]
MPDVAKFPGLSWKCESCSKKTGELGGEETFAANLIEKLNFIMSDIKDIKTKQNDIVASMEYYGAKIDDFSHKMEEFDSIVKSIPKIENKVVLNTSEIDILKSNINSLEQQMRSNNIIINGIPESKNENVIEIVEKVIVTLGVNEARTIESCYRVPQKDQSRQTPKGILVKFALKSQKTNVITAIRRMKGITTGDIGFEGNNNKIFINDHLTPRNQLLYKNTREICKQKNVSCWTRDCKIYLRDPKNAKQIHIDSEDALHEIIKAFGKN